MPTDHAHLLSSLAQPGDMIADKYRVERVIAVGGMGVVLAARNEDLDQQVAIKLLRQDALTNEEAVTRFLREARTAARLQSEHIARVFDVGTTETGVPYMVMEHLNGLDLQQVINTRGPLPVRDAVDYILQVLEAVAEAHAAGVVHRDLKPSNLFLAARPDGTHRIKVLDFGISKGQGLDAPAAGPALTSTKQVMGSPGYMSPEQMIRPRDVDGRTDIWSLGIVLYALLTGGPPFQGETVAAVMANILHEPVPRLRDKRADAPAALERVIERCLERDLGVRFTTVAQVARALAPFGSSFAKLSVSRVESALGSASPAGQTLLRLAETRTEDSGITGAAWAGTSHRQSSRRKLLFALGGAGAVIGLIGLGVWLGRSGSGPAAAPIAQAAGPIAAAPSAEPAVTPPATVPATVPATATAPATAPAPATAGAPSAVATGAPRPPGTGAAPRPGGTAKPKGDDAKFLEDRK